MVFARNLIYENNRIIKKNVLRLLYGNQLERLISS